MADTQKLHVSLISAPNQVESPFVIVKIGDATFGSCTQKKKSVSGLFQVDFPNFIDSLEITKINGQVNLYKLKLIYGITQFDDPNKLDKVLSSVSKSRKIKLTYGDWNQPGYIFREEEAIITKVTTNVNFKNSQISYLIDCTSTALTLTAGSFDFPAVTGKPSDIIKKLIQDKTYGLQNVFTGMSNMNLVKNAGLIAGNDKTVSIPAKPSSSPLDYLNYLVGYMGSNSDTGNSVTGNSVYKLVICDDTNNEYGGSYFKVVEMPKTVSSAQDPYNTYEVDVGYPGDNFVTSFSLRNDDSWAMLYEYSQSVDMNTYSYHIDDNGQIVSSYSPSLTQSNKYYSTTQANKTWWTQMTEFPIQATLEIKGLLRPALLMQYVRVNSYFYGKKYVASGLYIITKQIDSISGSGYKTTLSLTRIGGD